jgi:hypothetical protein
VALGIADQKKSDLAQARAFTSRALAADLRNPGALKNLGAILGREGDRSIPRTPQTVHAPAFAYMELGDIEQAQKHFQTVQEMEAPENMRGLIAGTCGRSGR